MGGVYRIQIFFGFLYIFYIYKAPKSLLFQCLYADPCSIISSLVNQRESDVNNSGVAHVFLQTTT